MTPRQKKWLIRSAAVLFAGVAAVLAWQRQGLKESETGLVSGNGRIEAVEIDVASRTAGRVEEIRVREGEFITAGQVLALMDADVLNAERRQAEAQLQQANSAVVTARSQIAQRESDKAAAQAVVAQREAELKAARPHLERSMALAEKGFISPQVVDDERSRVESAEAALSAAHAQACRARRGSAPRGNNPQDAPDAAVGQKVGVAVRALPDVADPLA